MLILASKAARLHQVSALKASVEDQLDSPRVAHDCLHWARVRIASRITGLTPHVTSRLASGQHVTNSPERLAETGLWYARAKNSARIEACIFISRFRRLRKENVSSIAALLVAYKHLFRFAQGTPGLPFEEAFDFAAKSDGRALGHMACEHCRCQYIRDLSSHSFGCPFCSLLDPSNPWPEAMT